MHSLIIKQEKLITFYFNPFFFFVIFRETCTYLTIYHLIRNDGLLFMTDFIKNYYHGKDKSKEYYI